MRHEDVRLAIGQAEGPNSQERVVLSRERDIGDRLVASDIEQTDRYGMWRECRDDPAVRVGLLILGGRTRSLEKQKLGSEEADAMRAQGDGSRRLVRRADVRNEVDGRAIFGDGWKRGLPEVATAVALDRARASLVARDVVRVGRHEHFPTFAIDRERRSGSGRVDRGE